LNDLRSENPTLPIPERLRYRFGVSTLSLPKRFSVSLVPKNSDLFFVGFGILYFWMVYHTGFPFSRLFFIAFMWRGVELVGGVLLLSLPLIVLKALYFASQQGWNQLRSRSFWAEMSEPYLTLEFVSLTARRVLIIFGAIYLFLHLKHLILWWHKANYDLFFWNLDKKIHFGIQPNIWAMEKFGAWDDAAVLLDWLYSKYFAYKLFVAVVFLMEPRGRKLTDQFFLAYLLLWFLGGLLYIITPTDGPCYSVLSQYSIPPENRYHMFQYPVVNDVPRSYIEKYVNAKIWYAKIYQEKLWVDRQAFLNGKALPGVFYGVAAMPSLHNAAVWMIMLFLFRLSPIAGVFGIFYVISTFLGSIFLQWHFAVDGYVGALLGIFITWFSMKTPELAPLFMKRWKKTPAEGALQ